MNINVLCAVFKRNFVNYFVNPTGYVFICLFVLLSGLAAFWPHEFFNRNLANLDQLSGVFPLIMLIFIPAITMAVWADERRQGTDELLLTIPASDFDVVLGKYLAALAIFTLSLLFSLVCNYWVLRNLGDPDLGLFLGTYFGYWLIGLAMLGIGTVASFLTSNLTVGYVLGVVFNAPLVVLTYADAILPTGPALMVKQWSLSEQFRSFGRGVLSLSGIAYFVLIAAVCLYLSKVLIGRRHWGGKHRDMPLHYLLRVPALVLVSACVILLFRDGLHVGQVQARPELRLDVTKEKLSSLSPDTIKLLGNIDPKRQVQIDAFISPEVPEIYVPTRLNLIATLEEIRARTGGRVEVRMTSTEPYSAEAARADKRYGITPKKVQTMSRGAYKEDEIFLGAAITCGLEKVIVPFFDRGLSPEYELARSLATVTQQKRKKVGVLMTDAPLMNRFDPQGGREWPIIEELRKQYEVVRVDPSTPITEKYDVLLAVQPSSLTQEQFDAFLAKVRSGQPTAIFEDPFPFWASNVPGTSAPRRPPGGMMANPMMQQNLPKADNKALWELLGVRFAEDEGGKPGEQIVYQHYNPIPKLAQLGEHYPEFVFIADGCGAAEPFNEKSPITSGMQYLAFPFAGYVAKANSSKLEFTPLVETGRKTGTVNFRDMMNPMAMFGMGGDPINANRARDPKHKSFVLAAAIKGKPRPSPMMAADAAGEKTAAKQDLPGEKTAKPAKQPDGEMNVVLVADIDMLHQAFFDLRAQGEVPESGLNFDFDNVTFVLNTLDQLAGEDRFINIRKRRRAHRTLTTIDRYMEDAYKEGAESLKTIKDEYEKAIKDEEKSIEEALKGFKEQIEKSKGDFAQAATLASKMGMEQEDRQKKLEALRERLTRQKDEDSNKIKTDLNLQVNRIRNQYKLWAVVIPPIPPLLIGIGVLVFRRVREKEGVARSRLR